MSQTNFKAPPEIDIRIRSRERQVNIMAMQIQNQAQLETLLAGATPLERAAMIDRLRHYLQFDPDEKIGDCPACGLKRGTVIAHQCLTD